MIFAKKWERTILYELSKCMIFFLFTIFFIYVILDFSTRSTRFFCSSLNITDIFAFYVNHFLMRADLILPLTFMLSIIKVYCRMNVHNEIVSLHMAGISSFSLVRPLFFLAFLLSLFCFVNYAFWSYQAIASIEYTKNHHLRNKELSIGKKIQISSFSDGSTLAYSYYNHKTNELFDVFLIKSFHDIWHMKYLSLFPEIQGRFAEHFIKENGKLIKKDSFDMVSLSHLSEGKSFSIDHFLPYEQRSFLFLLNQKNFVSSLERTATKTHLHYKSAIILFPFLIAIALSPFCLRFSKNVPIFFISTFALFGFFAFFTIMDSSLILCENQAVPYLAGIWIPFLGTLSFFSYYFLKISEV